MIRRSVHTAEAELAYYAVVTALHVGIDLDDLRELAVLTHNVDDLKAAVEAMREEHARPRPGHRAAEDATIIEAAKTALQQRVEGRRNRGSA